MAKLKSDRIIMFKQYINDNKVRKIDYTNKY